MRAVRANQPDDPIVRRPPPAPSHPTIYLGRDDPPARIIVPVARRNREKKHYHVANAPNGQPLDEDEHLSATEIADLLGVTAHVARERLRASGIAPVRKTQWQRLRWPRKQVLEWIADRLVEETSSCR